MDTMTNFKEMTMYELQKLSTTYYNLLPIKKENNWQEYVLLKEELIKIDREIIIRQKQEKFYDYNQ